MSFMDLMSFSIRSKIDACDVYSIKECKQISPSCSGTMSSIVGSAAAALSPVGVVLFGVGEGTALFIGALFVK